jgi:chlorobactene glucosyltransferase
MMPYLTHGLIISIIFFLLVVLVIILSNILMIHRTRRYAELVNFPFVSVLIPARNEEKCIGACVQSLLDQDYPAYEVIVLDDQSSDNTHAILEQIANSQPRMKLYSGSLPPEGFAGKNWACAQLAEYSQGDLLLFTDADTIYKPQALRLVVSAMQGEKADLITGFPQQLVGSWGERLLVPFFSWAMLSFIPLWLAYRIRLPALTSAVGQIMLFQRQAYQKIGGHASLDSVFVDDLTLTRRIKAAGRRWRVMKVSDLITCRMYQSSQEAYDGFARNLFAAFEFHILAFLFVYLWLAVLFIWPLIALAAYASGQAHAFHPNELLLCIGLSVLVWTIPYFEIGVPFVLGFIYPTIILANEVVAFRSLIISLTGRLSWKGRTLVRPRWKW